jgi:cob(I)alamin adenosyltransferase
MLDVGCSVLDVLSMSIATKTGDDGSTALMYGRRVSKNDVRVAAYGTVDELNAALGFVRATAGETFITDAVFAIQKELVVLMGELAVADEDRERYAKGGFQFVQPAMVDALTAIIDDIEKNHKVTYDGWATPGATLGSAALDLARTTCRRAERHVIALRETGAQVNPEIIRYLNRLSDLCWLWARWVETKSAVEGAAPSAH